MFHPSPAVADVCGLWRRVCPRHCRRSIGLVIRHRLHASTSLRPLAPRALPRFIATTDALTPAGRLFGPVGHEHRPGPDGSPCLSSPHFQPFRPQPPRRPAPAFVPVHAFLCRGPQAREPCPQAEGQLPTWVIARASHSTRRLAGRRGRIGFTVCHVRHGTLLRTGRSPPATSHPVLPRRSSLRLQAGERSAWRGLPPR
jgi:hypothetical protein